MRSNPSTASATTSEWRGFSSASEPRGGELHVGFRPGLLEALLEGRHILALGARRLHETEQRPAIVRVAAQILPIDGLGLAGAAGFEQHRAQGLPHGVVVLRRLRVDEAV